MDLELAGKRVVVTGASKGIGYACAAAFAAEGARVVVVSRSQANLDAAIARFPASAHAPVAIAAGTTYRVVVTPGQGFAPGMTVPQIATG